MTNEELWQAVLAQIQFKVSRANFATWFKNTKIAERSSRKIIISVENAFTKEWLKNKYQTLILKILRSLDKNIKAIDFKVESLPFTPLAKKRRKRKKELIPEVQLAFQELEQDKETNLNPRYTFENFVVGSFNELAHAAALAVCEKPGQLYNPLFVYGGVGLGKTHLLQAIGNKISKKSNIKVRYIPSERFISGIVEAIRNHGIEDFKKEFSKIDVLIVDDVQFFAGKEKSQEEFFHIFNILYQSQKQIVLSSDRSPKAIPAIEERLKSRFEGGMIADIGLPDLETRIAILKTKCEEKRVSFPKEVIEFVATNITNNIRELESALNKLIVFQKINNKTPDLEVTKTLLGKTITPPKRLINFKKLVSEICSFYDIGEKEIFSKTRKKEIVKPRQILIYLLREELNESFSTIARRCGGKDHTTIIYAYKKIKKELIKNDNLLTEINLLKQRIYSF